MLNTAKADEHEDEHVHTDDVESETEAEAGHDHAKDHGDRGSVIAILGKFHPVVIHFPIALVITGFFLAGLSMVGKKEIYHTVSIRLVYLASLTAVVAALLGLAAGSAASYPSMLAGYFTWHRILGISSAIVTLITAAFAFRYERGMTSGRRLAYQLSLAINAALIAVTGHFGATLIYGPDHFSF